MFINISFSFYPRSELIPFSTSSVICLFFYLVNLLTISMSKKVTDFLDLISALFMFRQQLWFALFCLFTLIACRPVEEGEWSSNYCELRDSNYFGIIRESIFRIDFVIRLKDGRNLFSGSKISKIAQNQYLANRWY